MNSLLLLLNMDKYHCVLTEN